ncbi:MAG: folate family ECF transporter S component [Firmicutes bacterium]|nr:folate family ECF transporter S component [Bacillota bacterium]
MSNSEKKKSRISTKMLVTLAMLLALEIVLSRFLSIQTPITRIGFGFVPLVLAGILFGPVPAAIVAVLADLLGALLFPTGPYYPPLTITSLLVGLTYGFFLYKVSFDKKTASDWVRIVLCAVVRQGVWALLLQSYWLSLLYGITYKQCLATRVPQVLILCAVEIVFIPVLVKVADMLKKAVNY